MAVLAQSVGAAHHEEGAVHHVASVKNPSSGSVQDIALEDFHHHHEHQGNDEPSKGFADPGADLICCAQQFLCIHKRQSEKNKTHPGALPPNGFRV